MVVPNMMYGTKKRVLAILYWFPTNPRSEFIPSILAFPRLFRLAWEHRQRNARTGIRWRSIWSLVSIWLLSGVLAKVFAYLSNHLFPFNSFRFSKNQSLLWYSCFYERFKMFALQSIFYIFSPLLCHFALDNFFRRIILRNFLDFSLVKSDLKAKVEDNQFLGSDNPGLLFRIVCC